MDVRARSLDLNRNRAARTGKCTTRAPLLDGRGRDLCFEHERTMVVADAVVIDSDVELTGDRRDGRDARANNQRRITLLRRPDVRDRSRVARFLEVRPPVVVALPSIGVAVLVEYFAGYCPSAAR
jgi:hypothetical protein